MIVYIADTGKTVTVDVANSAGLVSSGLSATEAGSTGVYRATLVAAAGVYWLRWNNTTDVTEYRERIYWDGSAVAELTPQQVRDAMKLTHTDGTISLDAKVTNLQALQRR